jgi:hypothetical protein
MKLYKTIAWIVLTMSLINIIMVVAGIERYSDDRFIIKVAPKDESTLSKEPIKQFEGAALYFKGDLEIKDFPWWKRTLLSQKTKEAVCMSSLAILVLLIIKTIEKGNSYHRKIGKYILYGGGVFAFSTLCDIIQRYFLKAEVLTRTHGDFYLLRNDIAILPDTYIGLILFIFSAVYTEAYKMKTEQDLTI